MRNVKKFFYASNEIVNYLTSEAVAIMEPGTEMKIWIRRNGRSRLETNSPAVLELFQTKIIDLTDKKKDEND